MSDLTKSHDNESPQEQVSQGKRTFLKVGAASLAALALGGATTAKAAAEKPAYGTAARVQTGALVLPPGDIGILNYAYALEQLEAAFYTRVVANPGFSQFSDEERQVLTDLRDHEVIHREFFRAGLESLGAAAVPPIPIESFNFSQINLNDRYSVLTASQGMEDTGVAAYNGAGQTIVNTDYLVVAGKIVSVEARHAAIISDLRATFATTANGVPLLQGNFARDAADPALDTITVISLVQQFFPVTIVGTNLPTPAIF